MIGQTLLHLGRSPRHMLGVSMAIGLVTPLLANPSNSLGIALPGLVFFSLLNSIPAVCLFGLGWMSRSVALPYWFAAAGLIGFLLYSHGSLDLGSSSTASIALIFFPIFALVPTLAGWGIGWLVQAVPTSDSRRAWIAGIAIALGIVGGMTASVLDSRRAAADQQRLDSARQERSQRRDDVHKADSACQSAFRSREYEQAFESCLAAAKSNHRSAQNLTGILYENGWGVATDYLQAMHWYEAAARQADPYGQYNLAQLYRTGKAGVQSKEKAVEYYLLAAEQGYGEAQFSLGVMHFEGSGTPVDMDKARYWWEQAQRSGVARAEDALKMIPQ